MGAGGAWNRIITQCHQQQLAQGYSPPLIDRDDENFTTGKHCSQLSILEVSSYQHKRALAKLHKTLDFNSFLPLQSTYLQNKSYQQNYTPATPRLKWYDTLIRPLSFISRAASLNVSLLLQYTRLHSRVLAVVDFVLNLLRRFPSSLLPWLDPVYPYSTFSLTTSITTSTLYE